MTTPRKHAELAQKYFSDSEMRCWYWDDYAKHWKYDLRPDFCEGYIYHVGKEEPTEPPAPMCELAGVKFPMPEQEPLKNWQKYWLANVNAPRAPDCYTWTGAKRDRAWLARNIVHPTEAAAIQHGKALRAANLQAIERAKEKMK